MSKAKQRTRRRFPSKALDGLRSMLADYSLPDSLRASQVYKMSDREVEAAMQGHANWDDRPKGWTKRDLLMWSRGYLQRERSLCGNVESQLRAEIAALEATP